MCSDYCFEKSVCKQAFLSSASLHHASHSLRQETVASSLCGSAPWLPDTSDLCFPHQLFLSQWKDCFLPLLCLLLYRWQISGLLCLNTWQSSACTCRVSRTWSLGTGVILGLPSPHLLCAACHQLPEPDLSPPQTQLHLLKGCVFLSSLCSDLFSPESVNTVMPGCTAGFLTRVRGNQTPAPTPSTPMQEWAQMLIVNVV